MYKVRNGTNPKTPIMQNWPDLDGVGPFFTPALSSSHLLSAGHKSFSAFPRSKRAPNRKENLLLGPSERTENRNDPEKCTHQRIQPPGEARRRTSSSGIS